MLDVAQPSATGLPTGAATDQYYAHLDYVKICAIVLVVVVHVAAPGSYLWGAIPVRSWWISTAFGSMARTCVPLFLMASGATLLDSRRVEPVTRFLARRVRRIAVPLVVWSFIYLADRAWVQGESLSVISVARYLATGTTFYHMPFFYYLIGLYLSAPILAPFAERARGDAVLYLVLLWGVTASAQSLASLFGIQLGITIPAIAGYSGYFMLGRMLRDTAISGRAVPLYTLVAIAAWLITLMGTYRLTSRAGYLDQFAFDYGSPNVIAMTLSSYLVLASQPVRHFIAVREPLTDMARRGAGLTLGIFLVHPLLLQLVLPQLHLNWSTGGPLIGVPLSTVVTLCLSAAIVAGLNRVPILRSAVS